MAQKIKNKNKIKMFLWQKDSIYLSWWFHKFISKLMLSGKKVSVEKNINTAFNQLKITTKILPFYLFMHFFEKIKPFLSTVSKRLGRKFYLVPVPLRENRQYVIGLKWIIQAIKMQKQKTFSKKLIHELEDIFIYQKGTIFKKRNQEYKTITEARVYSRYRWI